jgi:perosamine synthetase
MTTAATMIPHSRPSIEDSDIRAAADVLRSGRLAQGPLVEQFERRMAGFFGLAGGVAVNSGTSALEVALRVLGIGPGDEVILPSYVCAAPWLAVQRVGATAQLVDIEPETYNIDPDAARRALGPKTRAIIVPHLFGLPADLTALERLGVPLIEDCAQTLGATVQERAVGSAGVLTVCSFYATKLLCTGEGGMVLSRDAALLERARALREYDEGVSLDPAATNLKMTDLQAAIGCSQLERLPEFLLRRRSIADTYHDLLMAEDLERPCAISDRTHVYYRYVVRLPKTRGAAAATSALLLRLERKGAQCRRPVFRPLHQYFGSDPCPVSEDIHSRALSLPLYPSLQGTEVVQVAQILREELGKA